MSIRKEGEKMEKLRRLERKGEMEEVKNLWDWIIEMRIATEEELQLMTDLVGYNVQAMSAILFARTGYCYRECREE
jgi:hypothetical protein